MTKLRRALLLSLPIPVGGPRSLVQQQRRRQEHLRAHHGEVLRSPSRPDRVPGQEAEEEEAQEAQEQGGGQQKRPEEEEQEEQAA